MTPQREQGDSDFGMTELGGAKLPCDWTSEEFVAELARASYAAHLGASPRTQSQRAFAL